MIADTALPLSPVAEMLRLQADLYWRGTHLRQTDEGAAFAAATGP